MKTSLFIAVITCLGYLASADAMTGDGGTGSASLTPVTVFELNGLKMNLNKLSVVSSKTIAHWGECDENSPGAVAQTMAIFNNDPSSTHYFCPTQKTIYVSDRGDQVELGDVSGTPSIVVSNADGSYKYSLDLIRLAEKVGGKEAHRIVQGAFSMIQQGCQINVSFSEATTPYPAYNPPHAYLDANKVSAICAK